MAIKIIRGDGMTVTAYDDAVAMDYAFGGQTGVLPNVTNEMSYDSSVFNIFKVKSGMAVIQGRQFIIETEESVILNVPIGSTSYFYTLYAEMDMSAVSTVDDKTVNGAVTLKAISSTTAYPAVPVSDDLNENKTGKANMPLYRFKQTSTQILDVERAFEWAYYSGIEVKNKSNRFLTIAELNGNNNMSVIQQSGTLMKGWYELELSGGGGGAANVSVGGSGGYISTSFFIPHTVSYKLMAGGGGVGNSAGGGGGGGSVLDIPQLGLLFIASGGGGGGDNIANGGGGGGGYGSGGAGGGGYGGAGGGNSGGVPRGLGVAYLGGTNGNGAGGGGGGGYQDGGSTIGYGGRGGGVGGVGGFGSSTTIIGSRDGNAGGNNMNTTLGGGASGAISANASGGNGYARLYKLG